MKKKRLKQVLLIFFLAVTNVDSVLKKDRSYYLQEKLKNKWLGILLKIIEIFSGDSDEQ